MEQYDAARGDLQKMLRIIDDEPIDPDNHFRIHAMMMLAAVELESGSSHVARRLCQDLIDRYRPPDGSPTFWFAVAYTDLARCCLALASLDEAKRNVLEAVQVLKKLSHSWPPPFLYLASVLAQNGDGPNAARLLGYVDNWYGRAGTRLGTKYSTFDTRVRATILDALDELPKEERDRLREFGARQTFSLISALADGLP